MRKILAITIVSFFYVASGMEKQKMADPHKLFSSAKKAECIAELVEVLSQIPLEEGRLQIQKIKKLASVSPQNCAKALRKGLVVLSSKVEQKDITSICLYTKLFSTETQDQLDVFGYYYELQDGISSNSILNSLESEVLKLLKDDDQKRFFNDVFKNKVLSMQKLWHQVRIKQLKKLKNAERDNSCCEDMARGCDIIGSAIPVCLLASELLKSPEGLWLALGYATCGILWQVKKYYGWLPCSLSDSYDRENEAINEILTTEISFLQGYKLKYSQISREKKDK